MTQEEAQEAEAEQDAPLKLTGSGMNSGGQPYQIYEGTWSVHGNDVALLSLNYVQDTLVEVKYLLEDASFDAICADLVTLYGTGASLAGDGSAFAWQVWMRNPAGEDDILTFLSVVSSEDGVRLTFRDWELYQSLTGK